MAKMIQSKYGYETSEWIQADARLDKWLKNRRLANKQGVFNLENKPRPSDQRLQGKRV